MEAERNHTPNWQLQLIPAVWWSSNCTYLIIFKLNLLFSFFCYQRGFACKSLKLLQISSTHFECNSLILFCTAEEVQNVEILCRQIINKCSQTVNYILHAAHNLPILGHFSACVCAKLKSPSPPQKSHYDSLNVKRKAATYMQWWNGNWWNMGTKCHYHVRTDQLRQQWKTLINLVM